jgi:hypothetical protein
LRLTAVTDRFAQIVTRRSPFSRREVGYARTQLQRLALAFAKVGDDSVAVSVLRPLQRRALVVDVANIRSGTALNEPPGDSFVTSRPGLMQGPTPEPRS